MIRFLYFAQRLDTPPGKARKNLKEGYLANGMIHNTFQPNGNSALNKYQFYNLAKRDIEIYFRGVKEDEWEINNRSHKTVSTDIYIIKWLKGFPKLTFIRLLSNLYQFIDYYLPLIIGIISILFYLYKYTY